MSPTATDDEPTIVDGMADTLRARLPVLVGLWAMWVAATVGLSMLFGMPVEPFGGQSSRMLVLGVGHGLVTSLIGTAIADQVLSLAVGRSSGMGETLRRALAIFPTVLALALISTVPPGLAALLVLGPITGEELDVTVVADRMMWVGAGAILYQAAIGWALSLAPSVALVERRGVWGSLAGALGRVRRDWKDMLGLLIALSFLSFLANFLFVTVKNVLVTGGVLEPSGFGAGLYEGLTQGLIFCVAGLAWPAAYLKLRARHGEGVEGEVARTFE
jgi:hypothetical protein